LNQIEGRGGDDSIVGNTNSRILFTNAAAGVRVNLAAETLSTSTIFGPAGTVVGHSAGIAPIDVAGVGFDTFVGVNQVRGSEFGDIIIGDGASNGLEGRGGADVLDGGAANDQLTGGTGADIFVYGAASGNDRITDFNRAQGDRIDLRAFASIDDISNDLVFTAGTAITGGFTVSPGGPDTRITTNPISIFGGGNTIQLLGVASTSFVVSDFILAGQVAMTVHSPDGYDFGALYADAALADPIGLDATHFIALKPDSAPGANDGKIFVLTSDALGFAPGVPYPTGTVNEVSIYDLSYNLLASSTGWSFALDALLQAIDDYFLDPADTDGLDAIFNAARYSVVGTGGAQSNEGPSQDGADVFFGGDLGDIFIGLGSPFGPGNPGSDTVDYSHATARVDASLINPLSNTGAAAGDIYVSIENLRGTRFNDTLTGDGNNNIIEGGDDADTLDGGAGGSDTVSYEHSAGAVTVTLGLAGPQSGADADGDLLSNFENLSGSAFADTLRGDVGTNQDNFLIGNAGADTFVFGSNDGHDTIGDFEVAGAEHDLIDISALGIIPDLQAIIDAGAATQTLDFGVVSITLTGVDFDLLNPNTHFIFVSGI
jgi:Ca2+-binding RTX toxin-like protein